MNAIIMSLVCASVNSIDTAPAQAYGWHFSRLCYLMGCLFAAICLTASR